MNYCFRSINVLNTKMIYNNIDLEIRLQVRHLRSFSRSLSKFVDLYNFFFFRIKINRHFYRPRFISYPDIIYYQYSFNSKIAYVCNWRLELKRRERKTKGRKNKIFLLLLKVRPQLILFDSQSESCRSNLIFIFIGNKNNNSN